MENPQPTIMLMVRGLKSDLSREELERRYRERLPQFRQVAGLIQKYYSYDESTGEWAGIYLWDSEESLARYPNRICARVSRRRTNSQNRRASSAFRSWTFCVRLSRARIDHGAGAPTRLPVPGGQRAGTRAAVHARLAVTRGFRDSAV